MDEGIEMRVDAKQFKDSFVWTDERVKLLIDIGVDQSRKGFKLNTSFTKDGWANILQEFNKNCGKHVTMTQLKNKWNILKATWVAWMWLKNKTSGWGWDATLGTVEPPSAEHWNSYVKKHPHGKHFKTTPLQNEEQLRELFYGVVADGEGAICIHEDDPPLTTTKGISTSNSVVNLDLDFNGSNDDEPIEISNIKKAKRRASHMVSNKRSKSSDSDKLDEAINKMVSIEEYKKESMIAFMEMKKKELELKRAEISGEKKDTTFDKACQILDSLEGMEAGTDHHVLALEVLEDQNKRALFISMNNASRLPWLLRAIKKKESE